MKKIVIILMVLFITKGVNAQTGVPGTLAYLKQVEANKSKFIGKTFSVLLNDLTISVKSLFPTSGMSAYKNKETSTNFYLIKPEYMEDFGSYNFEIK